MCVPSRTRCPTLKGYKLRYLVYDRKSLEPRVLPWLHHSMSHLAPLRKVTTDAKFKKYHLYIFRDILDFVIYVLVEQVMTSSLSHLHNRKTWISP